ncbi:MAG: alpha-galactosidase [Spirochaetia bacterium]|nr:alpha-galactosidase [Spirochaetia bacterium]
MINEKNGVFILSTANTTYIFQGKENEHLEHLYYGAKLNEKSIKAELLSTKYMQIAGTSTQYEEESKLNLGLIKQEVSTPGKGDYRESFANISYNGGMNTLDFLYVSDEITNAKPKTFSSIPESYGNRDECDTLKVTLKDKILDIKLVLTYGVFTNCDVISRKAELYNYANKNITIESLYSLQLDIDESDFDLITFDGAWARERHINKREIKPGIVINDSKVGTSSAQHNPLIYLCEKNCSELNGKCYATNLIYSGNHKELVEVTPYNQTRILTGINDSSFKWILHPNERFTTPEAIMSYSEKGHSALSSNFQYFANNNIVRGYWKNKERPILVNSWEAFYFDFDDTKVLNLAKKAKEIGAELFVLDDGWFGNRNDDTSSLGDWIVNTSKLSEGIGNLSSKIHKLKMLFGLWVEPEMISKNSNLFDTHPDWAIMIPGRKPSVGRNQFILDLSRDDVICYLEDTLSDIFLLGEVDYVKWDFNRVFSDIYSSNVEIANMGEFMHRYYLGLYKLLDRLTRKFPKILFESCSAGGNRFDLAMLSFMPQNWTSDCTDVYERLFIQEGTSFGYPLSAMTNHVSASPNHQTLRHSDIESRFNVASIGNLGYEIDLNNISKNELEQVKEQINFYKRYRNTLQFGFLTRLSKMSDNNERAIWAVMNKDKSEIIVLDFRTRSIPNPPLEKLKLPIVDNEAYYELFNRPQKFDLSVFGDLVQHFLPTNLLKGKAVDEFAKIFQLNIEIAHHRVYGELLSKAGLILNQEYGGTGFENEVTRVLGDYGSRLYILKKLEI